MNFETIGDCKVNWVNHNGRLIQIEDSLRDLARVTNERDMLIETLQRLIDEKAIAPDYEQEVARATLELLNLGQCSECAEWESLKRLKHDDFIGRICPDCRAKY